MFHLISLNTLTSIPEIERIAREEPPTSAVERAEMWRCVRYAEGEHHVLFHAGQIFRLINELHTVARLPWWPVAAYRAAMVCWSLGAPAKSQADNQPEVSINTLLPDDEAMDRYLNDHLGTAVLSIADGSRFPVLEGNNSLEYCIELLGRHPTRLARGTQAKLKLLVNRWTV